MPQVTTIPRREGEYQGREIEAIRLIGVNIVENRTTLENEAIEETKKRLNLFFRIFEIF